jgi:hypothetical protein
VLRPRVRGRFGLRTRGAARRDQAEVPAVNDVTGLQPESLGFRIGREAFPSRPRYVARSSRLPTTFLRSQNAAPRPARATRQVWS